MISKSSSKSLKSDLLNFSVVKTFRTGQPAFYELALLVWYSIIVTMIPMYIKYMEPSFNLLNCFSLVGFWNELILFCFSLILLFWICFLASLSYYSKSSLVYSLSALIVSYALFKFYMNIDIIDYSLSFSLEYTAWACFDLRLDFFLFLLF